MNIGISELIFIVINVALIVGIPMIIVWAGILLFRRINAIESRIEKLESKQNTKAEKTP